ncbi:MAG TPA: aromatic ring-hydroxylating dioxygenase subunit alpha [Steroidobacteraceae bacterium]|nr:aromatic ring-hydroxylating dioxygenase subunit alpha [Steroidobacteraceae bacterium]
MYPLNTWYVAGRSDEFGAQPLARTICGQAMVLFRGAGGIAALEDFCPHRGAPLSLGRVVDGNLVCGYHGLTLDGAGRVVAMPCQRVQAFPRARVYPVAERHGFVWVWPGDAAKSTVDSLPQFEWLGQPGWAYGGGMYHIACDYRLMIDNLMDLTHETYVHASSIGQPEIDESPVETRTRGDEVITSRFMHGIAAPPFWRMALRLNGLAEDVPVDRWQICHFTPPSHIMIEVGVAHAGRGAHAAPDECKASSIVVDFITPETATSIWYFWGMARRFRPDDQALTDSIRDGQGRIFAEDREMLERQQRNHLAWPGRRLMALNIDSGGVRARKVIERMMEREGQRAES